MLELSERRRKRRIEKKLVDKATRSKEEIEKEMRYRELERALKAKEIEREIYLRAQQRLQMIEKCANDLLEKKLRLIHKIVEINAKDSLQKICSSHGDEQEPEESDVASDKCPDQPERSMTLEEIQEQARRRQRQLIEEKARSAREAAKESLAARLEHISRTPLETERLEAERRLSDIIRPEIEKKKKEKLHPAFQTLPKGKLAKETLLKQRKEQTRRSIENALVERHRKRCQDLLVAKSTVGLSEEEVHELLSLQVQMYETDIGIADGKMKELKIKIKETEQKIRQVDEETEIKIEQLEKLRNTLRQDLASKEV